MTDNVPDLETAAAAPDARTSGQRRREERRRLWDRRAREERRVRADRRRRPERRREDGPKFRERRAGTDRRAGDRRSASDRRLESSRRVGRRRRDSPEPYTSAEMTALRTRFAMTGPVSCPACGSAFTLGQGKRRGTQVARRVACLGCGRSAVVPHSRIARVIVVDHLGERRDALRAVLTHAGHEVVETDEAAVALHSYEVTPADVVMLNVLASGRLDAAEFLRRLRRAYPDARVVAVAGRTSQAAADPLALAHSLGAVQTLRIPAAPEAVLQAVELARA